MSNRQRTYNRKWLEEALANTPDSRHAMWVEFFGMEGTLDILEAYEEGNINKLDMRRRPFAGDMKLKQKVYQARAATGELNLALANILWEFS